MPDHCGICLVFPMIRLSFPRYRLVTWGAPDHWALFLPPSTQVQDLHFTSAGIDSSSPICPPQSAGTCHFFAVLSPFSRLVSCHLLFPCCRPPSSSSSLSALPPLPHSARVGTVMEEHVEKLQSRLFHCCIGSWWRGAIAHATPLLDYGRSHYETN